MQGGRFNPRIARPSVAIVVGGDIFVKPSEWINGEWTGHDHGHMVSRPHLLSISRRYGGRVIFWTVA